jgi:hypothetical protein
MNVGRSVAGLIGAVGTLMSLTAGVALAGPSAPHLNWGSQITPARCPADDYGYRDLVINVTHHVEKDADSDGSVAPGSTPVRYWARDDYNRHIQVWKIGVVPGQGDLFCALVHYQGSWSSIAGPSPQGSDTLPAGIDGTFHGGYRAAIIGELHPNPTFRTRGNIGKFDYGWDGHPTHHPPTPFDWIKMYFSGDPLVTYEFIGWIYRGGRNGTWVHACEVGPGCAGNQGDITD